MLNKLVVKEIPIIAIKPYWNNARVNEKTIEALKKSITTYGFNQPLVIDKDHVIIVGHSRYKAAIQLELTKIPCVIADQLTDTQAKEYRIADNKIHDLSDWDTDKLIIELKAMPDIGIMADFFPEVDLNDLIKDSNGFNNQPAIAKDAEQNAKQAKNQASEASQDSQDNKAKKDYRSISCPHCGEAFTLNQKEIDKVLKA